MQLQRRMVSPDLFADPDLEPTTKRLLYIGCMSIAEDSGCLVWKPGLLKALALPYDPCTAEDVKHYMDELVTDGRAWTYEVAGKLYAYLPEFGQWQKRLTRWGEPEAVPLPAGITFRPYESKERKGSGAYAWPASREELDPTALDLNDPNERKQVLDLKEAANSQRAGCGIPLQLQALINQSGLKSHDITEGPELDRLRSCIDEVDPIELTDAFNKAVGQASRDKRPLTARDLIARVEAAIERQATA